MSRSSILAKVLELPVEERAKLITELIDAFEEDPADDPALVEHEWATEIESRIARADSHPGDAIEWSDLRAKVAAGSCQ